VVQGVLGLSETRSRSGNEIEKGKRERQRSRNGSAETSTRWYLGEGACHEDVFPLQPHKGHSKALIGQVSNWGPMAFGHEADRIKNNA
jgi:hypothetical protein